tara:strand:+ start:34 stop:618 length:585 start_codon:yes stop_codon:yes gene_type:complete
MKNYYPLKIIIFLCLPFLSFSHITHFYNWGLSSTDQQISIEVGDTVTWTWVGGFHNLRSTNGVETFDSGFSSSVGFQFSHTFNNVGSTDFTCDPHASMYGTVTATQSLSTADQDSIITFDVYTNPANSFVNISSNLATKPTTVEIYDMLGRLKISKSQEALEFTTLDVSNLSPGMYFVNITSGNQQQSKKIIKL